MVEEKMGRCIGEVIDCSKFGSLEKLLQVTCFVQRFALNLKAKQMGSQGLQGSLSVAEMEKMRSFGWGMNNALWCKGIPFRK